MDAAGFFGKMPSHGDFVSRRIPRDFLAVWDNWLQNCLATSRSALGDDWLGAYLNSPIWRFGISSGVCGHRAYLGVLVPSVDRVSRYFPLCIVGGMPEGAGPLEIACNAQAWFERAERLLLAVLDDNAPSLEEFDAAVEALVLPPPAFPDGLMASPHSSAGVETRWRLPLQDADSLGSAVCRLSDALLMKSMGPYSAWWTDGSQQVSAVMVTTAGLPHPSDFSAMLADMAGAPVVARPVEAPEPQRTAPASQDDTLSLSALINMPLTLTCRSAGKSDVGKVRRVNEDALLQNPHAGLWLVADGMGGHADGKTASAAIVRAIDQMPVPGDLEDRIQAVSRTLQSVNRELRNYALRHPKSAGLGSTVALLLVAGSSCAVIWAGDTRVYRKRGRSLEQLTEDHSERQELLQRGDIASILSPANVVTRAIGGEDVLQLSTMRTSAQPGDRFLLCSDGVHSEVPANELFMLLEQEDREAACAAVLARVNEGRALDNATALIVDIDTT